MTFKHIFLFLFFILHIYYIFRNQKKIRTSTLLTSFQKKFHIILICLLPFFWFWMIKGLLTVSDVNILANKKFDTNNSSTIEQNNHYY
jgi:hypothetical protein